eukprot:g7974.t1
MKVPVEELWKEEINSGVLMSAVQTGFKSSSWWERCKIVKILINLGADTSLCNNHGSNALHFAAAHGTTSQIMEVLLKNSATDVIVKKNNNGHTPLNLAKANRGKYRSNVIENLIASYINLGGINSSWVSASYDIDDMDQMHYISPPRSVAAFYDIDDRDAWGTPCNPSTFAGLLLTLKKDKSVQLELVKSLMDQPRIHVVRYADGHEEPMHENMLATVVPGRNDRIVVLDPTAEEFGKRGVVKNKEEEDYIVVMDGSFVLILEANEIGKVQ